MKVATSSKARGPRGFYFLGFFGLRKEAKDSLDLSDSKLSEGLKKNILHGFSGKDKNA